MRDITLLERLASVLVLQGASSEAVSVYRELMERNPSDPSNYARLLNIILSSSIGDTS